MRKRVISIFVLLCVLSLNFFLPRNTFAVGLNWINVGTPGFSQNGFTAATTSMALDSNDVPYVAYSAFSARSMKYNGAAWENVGASGFSPGGAFYTNIAIDSSDLPYVAFKDTANSFKASVMKYNGAAWVNVGIAGFSAGQIDWLDIALDSTDTPYVAYRDSSNSGKITVMKYNGAAWVNVGTAGFSAGSVIYASIAIDSSDLPHVAYSDAGNSSKATVMKYNGAAWVNVGTAGFSAGQVQYTSLFLDSSDLPYVAYSDAGNSSKATVMKYNGAAWVNVGTAGFSADSVGYTSLFLDTSDVPYVAYLDYGNSNKATVMKYNGAAWENVGSAGFSAGTVAETSLFLDSNDVPYVAYSDGGYSDRATVMKFDTDTDAPTVSTLSPADNATEVSLTTNLVITFNETVIAETGNITIKRSSDDSTFEAIDVTSGQVTGSGTSTITVNPTSLLEGNTSYYVQIDATAFDDTVDNSFVGISDETTWNFATDSTPPTVNSFTPSDGEGSFEIDGNLVIEFSEDVEVGTGDITIYNSSDDSVFEAIDVTSGQVTGTATTTITINPTANLEAGVSYYIQIDATAFDDIVGNSFVGILDETTWNFTTDGTSPLIDSLSPEDNSTSYEIGDDIYITFDENVEVGTGYVTIYKALDDSIVETLDVEDGDYVEVDNSDVYFYLTNPLESDTEYYIQIDATAFDDTSGNSFAGIDDETTWNFRTYDDVNPMVTSLSPEDNENKINNNSDLVITFDEEVNIDEGYITIYKSFDDSQIEAVDVESEQVVGGGTNTITINLNTGLDYSTDYYVFVGEDAFYDENDNYFGGINDESVWNFTTRSNITSSGSTRSVALPKTIPTVPLAPLNSDTPLPCTNGALFSNITGLPCSTNVEVNTPNIPQNEDSNKFIFTKSLWTQIIDPDVKELQKYLNTHGYPVALVGSGSLGNETEKFGNLTRDALIKFQLANNITPAVGFFGPITRAKINGSVNRN